MITFANALYGLNKKGDARVYLEDALASGRRVLAPGHPLLLSALDSLGVVDRDLGRLPDAERVFREELDAQRHVHASDHPAVANVLANLGAVLVAEGGASRGAQAALWRKRVAERAGPPTHP